MTGRYRPHLSLREGLEQPPFPLALDDPGSVLAVKGSLRRGPLNSSSIRDTSPAPRSPARPPLSPLSASICAMMLLWADSGRAAHTR